MRSGLGGPGALFFNLPNCSANVFAGVAGQLDHVALPHALPHGVSHGNSKRGTGRLGAVLGGLLGAHCLPQATDGLFGGRHVGMFPHRCGHAEAEPITQHHIGHMDVASWMCGKLSRQDARIPP